MPFLGDGLLGEVIRWFDPSESRCLRRLALIARALRAAVLVDRSRPMVVEFGLGGVVGSWRIGLRSDDRRLLSLLRLASLSGLRFGWARLTREEGMVSGMGLRDDRSRSQGGLEGEEIPARVELRLMADEWIEDRLDGGVVGREEWSMDWSELGWMRMMDE